MKYIEEIILQTKFLNSSNNIEADAHLYTFLEFILFFIRQHFSIRCTTLLSPFFIKIWGFILKKWLPIYDSKYCPLLATTFFHLFGNCRIPSRKNDASFEAIHMKKISTGKFTWQFSTFVQDKFFRKSYIPKKNSWTAPESLVII